MKYSAMGLTLMALLGCGRGDSGDSRGPGAPPIDEPATVEESAAVFDEAEINDFRVTMAQGDWEAILADPTLDVWRPCTFQWKDEVLPQVGVQASGNSSSWPGNPKMSLKFHFNEFVSGRRFHGLKHLKLDGLSTDASMLRDRLAYGIFRARMAAPRSCHGRLFVNGEYRGLYEVEERIDSVFVKSRFGSAGGDLYRVSESGSDQYAWRGTDPASYVPYPWEPKTNDNPGSTTPYDPTRVVNFLDVLNHDPPSVGSVCDLEVLLEYFAVEAAIADIRGIAADESQGPNDHWQCRLAGTGRFVVIPWDLDRTFLLWEATRSIHQNFQISKISALVQNDAGLDGRYRRKIGEILDTSMASDAIHARIDSLYRQIRTLAYDDPNKPFTNQQFEDAVADLHEFVDQRAASLRAQIGP